MKLKCILLSLICFAPFVMPGCKKHSQFMGTATIIGGDPRMSICLGGTFIKIDGHPNPNDPTNGYYDIGSTPSTFPFIQLKYPTKVRLDWHVSPKCYGNYVDITRIEIIH